MLECDEAPGSRPVTIIVPRGELVPHARRLACSLGYLLEESAVSPAPRACKLLESGDCDVAIVLTAESATDRLLQHLLAVQTARFRGSEPWGRIPSLSLITGRDVKGVAWTIEKAIDAAQKQPTAPFRFRHLQCDDSQVKAVDLLLGAGEHSVQCVSLTGDRLEEELRRPVAAIAIDTHGTEGCGKADDHVVLCGLESTAVSVNGRRSLACGHGFKCPKGERPFALRQLQSRVACIASCGSLRLGNSPIQHGFNLGLSCLDGATEAYVGTILPSAGNRIASVVLLAALSTGCTLSETTTLVNALACAARLDSSTRVCVGMPDLRLLPSAPARVSEHSIGRDGIALALGDARFATIQVTTPWIIKLARLGRLALDIRAEEGSAGIAYFHRLEKCKKVLSLRVFLFRFPDRLGTLHIQMVDTRDVKLAANGADERVRKWWRIGLLVRQPAELANLSDEIPVLRETARITVEKILPTMGYDGSASGRIGRLAAVLGSTGEVLRNETTALLLAKFGRGFWLPNFFAPVQQLVSSKPIDCPSCGGLATHSIFEDSATRGTRQVDICAQCSILSDLTLDGPVHSVSFDYPRDAALGAKFDVQVRMAANPQSTDSAVELFARITTPGFGVLVPEPGSRSVKLRTHESARFSFDISTDFVPHYYFIKVLICSEGHLGFASRRLFLS